MGSAPLAGLRAAWWADNALRDARRMLARGDLSAVVIKPPPDLPPRATRGVTALLGFRRHSCLEGALVRQRWLAAQGTRRDVVIGVKPPIADFLAHAWLDGEEQGPGAPFHELSRLAP
jgi:hypothetical protein